MKIMYCLSGTFNSGGMERMIIQKANWLVKHSYEVCIITVEQKNRAPFFPLDERVRTIDLGVNYWDHKEMGIFKKIVSVIRKKRLHKKKLQLTIEEIKPDIIISTCGFEFDFLYKIKGDAKIIGEIHFQRYFMIKAHRKGILRFVDYIRTYVMARKISKYDKFVILTKEDLMSWPKRNNIIVIPNFTNISKQISDQKEKRAIAVGRLTYQKNFQALIHIWKEVCKVVDDWVLELYGDGEEKDLIIKLIKDLDLSSKVNLYPATTSIQDKYKHSSIFLMTSRYEGFPMVLCEAMNFGVVPIAFACKCGPKDIIEENVSGFLIKPDDITSMAEKVIELIKDANTRQAIGLNAHKRIESQFGEDCIMLQWSRLFEELIINK